jgi:glycosyltransferase involved in cell wall biosynthesis
MASPSLQRVPDEAPGSKAVSRISVITPMLNEAEHVEPFLSDVAAQDFPGHVEVLVADGGSTDGSVQKLEAAAARAGLNLNVLPNPAGWVSQGLNLCIREASGDLLVRLDCHSRYPPDYLRLCARAAEETDALAVGGVVVPTGRTTVERAVACAMASPFGGIGWTWVSDDTKRRDADTVTFGAFRPDAFHRAGVFDESLHRNQDDEMMLRIRLAGGRVILDPAIKVLYTPRGSYGGVFRQYYQYGLWKVPVMLKHGQVLSARSLAPLAFLTSLAVFAPVAAFTWIGRVLLVSEVGAYLAGALAFGARSIKARGEPLRLLPYVLAVYPTFHVAYGLGMLRGWARAARRR